MKELEIGDLVVFCTHPLSRYGYVQSYGIVLSIREYERECYWYNVFLADARFGGYVLEQSLKRA